MNNHFAPLRLGQRVRITKARQVAGHPVLSPEAWVDEVTEGTITAFKRVDSGVLAAVTKPDGTVDWHHFVIAWRGVMLNEIGRHVEILSAAPEQQRLFSGSKEAA